MSAAVDIGWGALALSGLLLIAPIVIITVFRLGQLRAMMIAVARMAVQLFLVGLLLVYLFDLNNPFVNVGWFLVMVGVAAGSVITKSDLRLKTLLVPAFLSILLSAGLVVLAFTWMILRLDNPLDARYFVALGGMLLGNSLRGNVVAVGNFYNGVRRDRNRHLYRLSLGAGKLEALLPNLRASLRAALAPTIATMATMGIVALPGMMTGQILGGSSPLVAVKYQVAIMVAILGTVSLSTVLCLIATLRTAFDPDGILRRSIFSDSKPSRR